jgi:hypothetical protein
MSTQSRRLSGARLVAVLLLPWAFLALFSYLALTFVLPHAAGGQILAICASLLMAVVFVSFTAAAITFSRDVLSGRYP